MKTNGFFFPYSKMGHILFTPPYIIASVLHRRKRDRFLLCTHQNALLFWGDCAYVIKNELVGALSLSLAGQSAANQKSTRWSDYQRNTCFWVGSKHDGSRYHLRFMVDAMTGGTWEKKDTEVQRWRELTLRQNDSLLLSASRTPVFASDSKQRLICVKFISTTQAHFTVAAFCWLSRESAVTKERHAKPKLAVWSDVWMRALFSGPWSAWCHLPGAHS